MGVTGSFGPGLPILNVPLLAKPRNSLTNASFHGFWYRMGILTICCRLRGSGMKKVGSDPGSPGRAAMHSLSDLAISIALCAHLTSFDIAFNA
jgi:hypothetical protein